jgi:PAS domain S-box-containing protein
VPFALGFQIYPWVERLLRVRQYPLAAYGFALAMVALAVFVRWLVIEYAGEPSPFVTFYPAIIIVALIGGIGPGILVTGLSSVAAWYILIPSFFAWPLGRHELVELLLFVLISGVDVAIAVVASALVERLVIQQRNIRILLESAPNGFVLVDEHGIIKLVNASTEKLFGYSREELIGKDVETLVPEHVGDHRKLRGSYQETPEVRLMGFGGDLNGRRKDGSEFPAEIGLIPIGRDEKQAVLATVMDISARKQAEKNQNLIIAELEHRTRNLFAVVLSIVANSLKSAKTVAEADYVLNGRVRALSQAYMLIADAAWESASLAQILGGQVLLDSKRVTVDGCEIAITPRAAQQFAMIAHELATNAIKYGALSVPDGRVSISGRTDRHDDGGSFVFTWKEARGPRVSPPTKRGFGSAILLEAAQQFGSVSMKYPPEGVTYQLKIDLKELEVPKSARTAPGTPRAPVVQGGLT